MVETLSQSKSIAWRRIFTGGLLSAIAAGIVLSLDYLLTSGSFWSVIFGISGVLIYKLFIGEPIPDPLQTTPSEIQTIGLHIMLLAVFFWFIAGFGLTYFIKSNQKALGAWLILIIIWAVVSMIWG